MDEHATARGDDDSKPGGISEIEARPAVPQRAVHEFANEAAVEQQSSRPGEDGPVSLDQVHSVRSSGGVYDGVAMAGCEHCRQRGLAYAVATFEDHDLVL
jgi:hypothetical protein